MKVLFLDDDIVKRIEPLKKQLLSACWQGHITYVNTASDAISELAWSSVGFDGFDAFDIAFLDHDLGGRQMVPSGPGEGSEVADYIATMKPAARPRRVVVHSFNPYGAKRMVDTLSKAHVNVGYRPFNHPWFWREFGLSAEVVVNRSPRAA